MSESSICRMHFCLPAWPCKIPQGEPVCSLDYRFVEFSFLSLDYSCSLVIPDLVFGGFICFPLCLNLVLDVFRHVRFHDYKQVFNTFF